MELPHVLSAPGTHPLRDQRAGRSHDRFAREALLLTLPFQLDSERLGEPALDFDPSRQRCGPRCIDLDEERPRERRLARQCGEVTLECTVEPIPRVPRGRLGVERRPDGLEQCGRASVPNALPGTIAFNGSAPATSSFVPLTPGTNTVRFGGTDGTSLLLPVSTDPSS